MAELTLFTGPMFSGKSLLLIREIDMRKHAGIPGAILKPKRDTRDGRRVYSRLGLGIEAHDFDTHKLHFRHLTNGAQWVAIDEGNFIEREMLPEIDLLIKNGVELIIAGLDLNFRGEPFGLMGEFAKRATNIVPSVAYCAVCKRRNATRTQRLIKIEGTFLPDRYSAKELVIDKTANYSYEARCEQHHEVPGRP